MIVIETEEGAILDPVGSGTWKQRPAEIRWCSKDTMGICGGTDAAGSM
jgi:hypothetical protein